jgi:hypothetical protein
MGKEAAVIGDAQVIFGKRMRWIVKSPLSPEPREPQYSLTTDLLRFTGLGGPSCVTARRGTWKDETRAQSATNNHPRMDVASRGEAANRGASRRFCNKIAGEAQLPLCRGSASKNNGVAITAQRKAVVTIRLGHESTDIASNGIVSVDDNPLTESVVMCTTARWNRAPKRGKADNTVRLRSIWQLAEASGESSSRGADLSSPAIELMLGAITRELSSLIIELILIA